MAGNEKGWKERERLRRQEYILAAAEICFAQKGYHSCTMEDIAHQVDCSVGSIYNFFKGKEEIYKAIFANHAQKNIEFLAKADFDIEKPLEAISGFIYARLEFGVENKEFIRMFLRNHMNDNFADESSWMESIWPVILDIRSRFGIYLRAGVSKGLLRDDLNVDSLVSMIEFNMFHILDDMCDCNCSAKPIISGSLQDRHKFLMDVLFNGIAR